MSWIVIVWAMMASACVTVGLMHLAIWLKQPSRNARLLLVAAGLSAAMIAALELALAQAPIEPRWAHVPVFTLIVAVAIFLTVYLSSAERPTDLARAEALQQRKQLIHLSRVAMLGELSGSIAHELNQPLAAILSNAQAAQRFLAQDKASLCEVRQILKDIVDEDKRAGELIRRLRILFKKGEIELQPLDANELVLDVLRLMRSDLINRRITASSELAPQLPEVRGDRVQLQQVLLNLLINAADSTPEGASEVHPLVVRTTRIGSGEVCISVTDQGRGIPPADLQQVFEPFMTTKTHGMGLGLTVCRTIMHAHRGRIWAENNAGPGATFHFSLPTTR